uniref:PepSY domain-containing protein n=1 Tax=Candidatus Kentrum sp. DK TaxID=2126562 RepID=A0A450S4L9_9GAMM|nr:MAG: hypothetical protein BECKDK2373C_GA0170839_101544 [Candidatus Kentron sp. DK]VFJ46734.1 MAG: hypothetical protein BECKDK2373B_GA0170837_10149 [Candidatus Kentron sp. DK]
MKTSVFAAALLVCVAFAGSSFASNKCNVPEDEWQLEETLQEELEANGWKIESIKVADGCYEVKATDEEGNRVEAYFDPKTFDTVEIKNED